MIHLDPPPPPPFPSGYPTIALLLQERGKTHGDFEVHAKITWAFKDIMHCQLKWQTMSVIQREALEMIAHKLGRIFAGDPNFKDHWADIAGYAKLVEDRL